MAVENKAIALIDSVLRIPATTPPNATPVAALEMRESKLINRRWGGLLTLLSG